MCLQARFKNWKGAGCTKVVSQCIPQLRGSSTESSCSRGIGNCSIVSFNKFSDRERNCNVV